MERNKETMNPNPKNSTSGNQLTLEMVDFRPEWQFEENQTGVFYKNGVIPGQLFLTLLGGDIQPESAKKALAVLENLFKSGVITNSDYIRIADYSAVLRAPISTRMIYANELNRLNSEYHCKPVITYICGASLLLKTMLRLFASYVKQQFIFVPTLADAFTLINARREKSRSEKPHQVRITTEDIEHFAAMCGHILFDEFYTVDEKQNIVSPDHPLHELYTIISLLNNDLRELKKTEKEQKEKINESLENARILNKKLSEKKKSLEDKEQIQRILIESLKKSRVEAEIANRAKSEFLANMSHEIRTPLHAVVGMTELLLDTPLNSTQRHYTDTIQASTKQLHQLINDILDFTKIESGQLDKVKSPFNLRALFTELSSILTGNAEKAGLQLSFIIPESVAGDLIGYPIYLKQALINLIQNAIKFTYKGGIDVRIATESETPGEITLRISVKDTGIGIPDEKKELVFQRFTQLDSSATRKAGGAGLGLAISTQLVEFMGGKLNLNSRKNEGSEFWFVISFLKPVESNKIQESESRKTQHSTPVLPNLNTSTANTRILLVEDNIINQQVAIAMLSKLAIHADIAANGLEAIDALKTKPYALVIMDLQMPLMGGIDAAKKIRNTGTGVINADIPIIAMTANATQEDKLNCQNAGMNDFITKPFVIKNLRDMLEKWIPSAQGIAE
ncbi:ATP-binding protein [Candidatus Chlorobium masyuteum]|uniref:ATP-binding protein n=1 Tax=Candidatus Chlorobium masyuteum TaxID=2716876 RepID=UPI001F4206A9|nr:ATP-binding protein [Candidatus Chlorobium masyuteum]